ncbi:MAG: glutamyl-tRNA reductase [Chitinophagaceae bacterium]|jgi:glutamyl-tRNA reductase|nr:glutamyl-tRNA reductase [Chitinophagaceae bacterium]
MELNQFFVTGVNYKKTDAAVRGQFALAGEHYTNLLQKANEMGLQDVFVLSTCNRTEIYGVAHSAFELEKLLCNETAGDLATFQKLSYTKSGKSAVKHFFSVASGLDSQILGDYEVVGQIKHSVRIAKEHGAIGSFLERLSNMVFQSSKAIKNQTALSSGTVSVAFAAIQFLKRKVENIAGKKILLIGTGKIGRNTCKNLIEYLGATNITLINRTNDKAVELAKELSLKVSPIENLKAEVNNADIVIVSTNAAEPIIKQEDLAGSGSKILLDLSIPHNIDARVGELPQITLINVDGLSKINDETLQMREREIPKVKAIINQYIDEFFDWYKMHQNAAFIRTAKRTLSDINLCPWYRSLNPEKIQTEAQQEEAVKNAVKKLAVKMRSEQQQFSGCLCIETLHEFIAFNELKKQS